MSDFDRIYSHIEFRDGHGFWNKSKYPSGYGKTILFGRIMTAHRAFLILTTGVEYSSLEAAHDCEFRDCIIHCRWATHKENEADKLTNTHCRHDHELTQENTQISSTTGYRRCRVCVRRNEANRTPRGNTHGGF